MKIILKILVLVFVFSNISFAEILDTNKTVNDYVNDDYTIVSVNNTDKVLIYTLRSNEKAKPLIMTCLYGIEKNETICLKP
jgi:hypothetical protein